MLADIIPLPRLPPALDRQTHARAQLRNPQGEPVLDFHGIPLAKLLQLVAALTADALAALLAHP